MKKKRFLSLLCVMIFSVILCACSTAKSNDSESVSHTQEAESEISAPTESNDVENDESSAENSEETAALLYMGQASIRIVTAEAQR